MVSYKVLSPSYDANLVLPSSISTTVNPAFNILGRTHEAPTVGSYKHFEGMLPKIVHHHGQAFRRHNTSGNPYRWKVPDSDFNDYKNYSPQVDDLQFGTWDDVTKKPQTTEYVFHTKKSISDGAIESFGEHKLNLPKVDTPVELYVHDTLYAGRINEFGRYSHLVRNLKQNLMEYYGLKSSQELSAFLKSKGLSLEQIGNLAVGFIPENAIYGVARGKDGKAIFFAGEDSHEILSEEARRTGLDIKILRAMGIDEEQTHNARRSYDKGASLSDVISEEVSTKRMQLEFYLQQAKGARGNQELVNEYLAKAAIMEGDIQTTRKRYSKAWKKHHQDLEEIVDADEHTHHIDENSSASHESPPTHSNLIYMPQTTNAKGHKKESYGKKGRVIYGNFDKSEYDNNDDGKKETSKKATKATAIKNSGGNADAQPDSEPSDAPAQAESTAEAA